MFSVLVRGSCKEWCFLSDQSIAGSFNSFNNIKGK